ncbi:zf-UBP-domain-containing protein [Myriangium duriaei CBS 260.36]|uniref:Zf-UBP-domain-containing protein n=1 Tax=Myriangium duriaei CBS 260.36 TaxID=1168546 RepID=A0A9P4MIY8_9PEZI|nr:zf-UBP-domain-containing protein [Myriangium duriaei CBS 260.36]
MHTFLYHLKLELYDSPLPDAVNTRTGDVFSPDHRTDIFITSLPVHRTTQRTHDFLHKRSKASISTPPGSHTPELRPGSAGQQQEHQLGVGDALLLPERNTALRETPAHVPSSPKPSPKDASKDWRFGPVSIDCIDMEPQRDVSVDSKDRIAKSQGAVTHTRAVYVPSDTKTTEVGWGVVHLYKDSQDVSDIGSAKTIGKHRGTKEGDNDFDMEKCTTLCILAVPSWMMPSDLLGFVGDQTRDDVSHFRLIRTGRANKYMVLMKFRSPKKARDWQKAWNGRLFSAMEPENCHVVFIKSVQFLTPDSSNADFPHNNADPFTTSTSTSLSNITPSNKPYAPPTPSLIELPTCPVCLERMDETTGLLTILCQHVFHCACLEKWRGGGCPVCRYTQSPSSTFPYPRPNDSSSLADPQCSVCASSTNLWICLICGNVGCGRYDSAHAYAHYEATSHCYAMDIASQHVWDYAGDGYVHRLIQNKDNMSTQKYIDLPHHPHHPNTAFRSEPPDSVPREKLDAMASEYTYLLTSQLDSQRRYFEEQMQRALDKAHSAAARADDCAAQAEAASARLATALRAQEAATSSLARIEAERDRAAQRVEKLDKTAREALTALAEERTISKGLVERNRALIQGEEGWKVEKGKMEGEMADLREMNRDLTMFVEGRETLERMEREGQVQAGEVEGGEVEVGASTARGRRKARKK